LIIKILLTRRGAEGGENSSSEIFIPPVLFFNFPKPNYLIFKIVKIFPKNALTNENLPAKVEANGGENAASLIYW
jgi:hypothetical protein